MKQKIKINFSRKRGFTLVELFTVIIIMIIFASFITMNMDAQRQTAKKETERFDVYLHDLMRKADRRHMNFEITNVSARIKFYWRNEDQRDENAGTLIYDPSPSDSDKPVIQSPFTLAFNLDKVSYDAYTNEFKDKGHFTLTRSDYKQGNATPETIYYLHFNEGRTRLSDNDKEDEDTEE